MIIYNIRKNGPYEKDKFYLNIGQLYNKIMFEKEKIKNDNIYLQLKALDNMVKNYTSEDSLANQILMIEKESDEALNE